MQLRNHKEKYDFTPVGIVIAIIIFFFSLSVSKDMKKPKPLQFSGETIKWYSHYGKQ